MNRTSLLACAILLGGAAPTLADTVTLKNGREIHGKMTRESKDSIEIRTSGGRIVINKAEIATFNENADYGNYDLDPVTKRRIAEENAKKAAEAEKGKKGQAGTAKPGPKTPRKTLTAAEKKKAEEAAKKKSLTKAGWEWGADVKEDVIEKLSPMRDKLHKELEDLGPTKEERLAEIELKGDEATRLRDDIQKLSWNRSRRDRGGNVRANVRRNNRMKAIVDTFGVKALPSLLKGLSSASYWIQRLSAQAIGKVIQKPQGKIDVTGLKDMNTEKARWLAFHFKVPNDLIRLLDVQNEAISAFLRADANTALEQVTGEKSRFQPGKDALRTPAETAAFRQWKRWWPRAQSDWEKREEEKLAKRAEIYEKLEKLQAGIDPDAAEEKKG